jgi:hypothetical protein
VQDGQSPVTLKTALEVQKEETEQIEAEEFESISIDFRSHHQGEYAGFAFRIDLIASPLPLLPPVQINRRI